MYIQNIKIHVKHIIILKRTLAEVIIIMLSLWPVSAKYYYQVFILYILFAYLSILLSSKHTKYKLKLPLTWYFILFYHES